MSQPQTIFSWNSRPTSPDAPKWILPENYGRDEFHKAKISQIVAESRFKTFDILGLPFLWSQTKLLRKKDAKTERTIKIWQGFPKRIWSSSRTRWCDRSNRTALSSSEDACWDWKEASASCWRSNRAWSPGKALSRRGLYLGAALLADVRFPNSISVRIVLLHYSWYSSSSLREKSSKLTILPGGTGRRIMKIFCKRPKKRLLIKSKQAHKS